MAEDEKQFTASQVYNRRMSILRMIGNVVNMYDEASMMMHPDLDAKFKHLTKLHKDDPEWGFVSLGDDGYNRKSRDSSDMQYLLDEGFIGADHTGVIVIKNKGLEKIRELEIEDRLLKKNFWLAVWSVATIVLVTPLVDQFYNWLLSPSATETSTQEKPKEEPPAASQPASEPTTRGIAGETA